MKNNILPKKMSLDETFLIHPDSVDPVVAVGVQAEIPAKIHEITCTFPNFFQGWHPEPLFCYDPRHYFLSLVTLKLAETLRILKLFNAGVQLNKNNDSMR